MSERVHTLSFSHTSPEVPQPDDSDSIRWTSSWGDLAAPSIAQLAQFRAFALESLSDFRTSPTSSVNGPYSPSSDTDLEKQKDSTIPSSNTSDVFIHQQAPDQPPLSQPSISITREAAFIFITCIAQFLSLGALNQTVAPVMVLADYFDIEDYGTLSWFSASFSMSVGTFILPAGKYTLYSTLLLRLRS